MTKELRKEIRETYSDPFLMEIKEILKLSKDFRFNENNMDTLVFATKNMWDKISIACKNNIELRKNFNIESKNIKLNEEWSYHVMMTYFTIGDMD